MGTRLYPMTKKPENLETLAGVEEGTFSEMEKLRGLIGTSDHLWNPAPDKVVIDGNLAIVEMPDGRIMEGDPSEFGYLLYKWKKTFYPEVFELEQFHLFGWGRLRAPVSRVGLDASYGSTTDPKLVRSILAIQADGDECFFDVEEAVELCEGLAWS